MSKDIVVSPLSLVLLRRVLMPSGERELKVHKSQTNQRALVAPKLADVVRSLCSLGEHIGMMVQRVCIDSFPSMGRHYGKGWSSVTRFPSKHIPLRKCFLRSARPCEMPLIVHLAVNRQTTTTKEDVLRTWGQAHRMRTLRVPWRR